MQIKQAIVIKPGDKARYANRDIIIDGIEYPMSRNIMDKEPIVIAHFGNVEGAKFKFPLNSVYFEVIKEAKEILLEE